MIGSGTRTLHQIRPVRDPDLGPQTVLGKMDDRNAIVF
jgi:hypothetical protein